MVVKLLMFGLASALIVVWLRLRLRGRPTKSVEFPPPPVLSGALPLIGHAHMLFGDTTHLWHQFKKIGRTSLKTGGAVTVKIGRWTFHVLTDPDDCLKVVKTCLNKDSVYDMAKPWIGDGLLSASETIWKRHHKLLAPGFHQQILDGYVDEFNRQGRKLINTFSDRVNKGPFDQRIDLEKTAMEIIYRSTMGFVDDEDDAEKEKFMAEIMKSLSEIFNNVTQRIQNVWLHNDLLYYWTGHRRRRDELITKLHKMTYTMIQKGKMALKKKESSGDKTTSIGSRHKSFFYLLLELAAEGTLTDTEVREEMDTIIAAGYDSSASFMTYILTLLGSFPEVQNKLHKELQEVFGSSDRDVEKQDFSRLVYLEAVLKETLRFCPIAPMIGRHLDEDVQLKKYTLPAGDTCFLFYYGMHRHPIWGVDAEEFKPERFLDRATPEALKTFAGFSFGRRICLGQKFAMMSAMTIVAHVVRKYEIIADHRDMEFKLDIILKPVSGHHITLKRRMI